jgi:excisionase family DNA binding protein
LAVATKLERRTYRMDELARLFGVGRNQIYQAAERGELPTIRLGKRIVAPKAAINRMLEIVEDAA